MLVTPLETEIKIIIVGNGGIGKTSLMTRFAEGTFDNQYLKTIGVDFLEKRMFVPSIHENVTFFLYDTAGQEEFASLTRTFYRGAGAAMIGFSTVDRASFRALPEWVSKVREECGQIPLVLVQTKTDLLDTAVVSAQEVDDFSIERNLRVFRVCAKEDVNVNEVFEQVCIDFVRRRRLLGNQTKSSARSAFELTKDSSDFQRDTGTSTGDIRTPNTNKTFLSNCSVM